MIRIKYTSPLFMDFVNSAGSHLFRRSVCAFTQAIFLCFCLLLSNEALADTIRIAVASNFTDTIKTLAKTFESKTNHQLVLSFGATGRHYAQIVNGAPFDIFFAADSKRPERLEAEGLIIANSRFTYALGKLVLWSPNNKTVDEKASILKESTFQHIAIANPKLAPYGKAAKEALTKLGHWESLKVKAVRGENIGQAFQFVQSGNAELGFVALSQLTQLKQQGSRWVVPESFYSPIQQQAVLLNTQNDNLKAAQEFLGFIKADEAQDIIKNFGYGSPIVTRKN